MKRNEKNISYSNDCLSDVDIDDEEGFKINNINIERISKVENRENLSIIFDKFDDLLVDDKIIK